MISTLILASLALATTASAGHSTATMQLGSATTIKATSTDPCSIDHATGFNDDKDSHTIRSGGQDRYYAVQVPASYNTGTRKHWPIIFDYHGSGQTPSQQAATSQYNLTAQGQEYLVVYPQGVGNDWEGAGYATAGVSDTQFTSDLLAHMNASYCLDSTRVYASGKSNGGGFVDLLACSAAGDAFHAFAMAAPALYTDLNYTACGDGKLKRAILQTHGTADHTIPYTGGSGRGGPLPDIRAWTEWWGGRDCGNDTKPAETFTPAPRHTTGEGYNTTSFSCHGFESVVTSHEIFGQGHCWPANVSNYDSAMQKNDSCKDTELSFTAKVLDFFAKWDEASAQKLARS